MDHDGTVPDFYEEYVKEVCDKVETKAYDEFKCEHNSFNIVKPFY